MAKKSENKNQKTQAQEILERIRSNMPQANRFGPQKDTNYKPNARLGSVNRSRR